MNTSLLACGPWFDETGVAISLALFLLVKPIAYYAFIQAYRFRVSRAVPMTRRRAAVLALQRMMLGLFLVGGGAFVVGRMEWPTGAPGVIAYLYASRLFSWWLVGAKGAGIRGWRLVGWIGYGTAINVAFDLGAFAGAFEGWIYAVIVTGGIAMFITVLELLGRRDALRRRFLVSFCFHCKVDIAGNLSGRCPKCNNPTPLIAHRTQQGPLCPKCQYNLTGNLSGICPECGTSVVVFAEPAVAISSPQ